MMKHKATKIIKELLSRRRKSANRRRGAVQTRFTPPKNILKAQSGEKQDTLPSAPMIYEIASKAGGYRGVEQVLCKAHDGKVDIAVVAPSPMTKPLKMLANSWCVDLRRRYPSFDLSISVVSLSPPTDNGYDCLFWRNR